MRIKFLPLKRVVQSALLVLLLGAVGMTKAMAQSQNNSISVVIGNGGTATNQYLPSYSYYNYSLSQQIYTADEIGVGGIITSVAFFNGGETKTRSYDIYMVQTSKTAFAGEHDWIAVTAADRVFSGSVTMVSNNWTTIEFNTSFLYDGVSNLALIVDDNTGDFTGSPHMACRVFNSNGNQAINVYSDGVDYNPYNPNEYYGTLHSEKNQITFGLVVDPNVRIITASVFPAGAGTVSGAGSYQLGEVCTLTATPNGGCTFINWTENNEVVSTNSEYSFAVTDHRQLVANFEDPIITFADANVKSICVSHWDTNGDGELSYAEAGVVTALGGDEWGYYYEPYFQYNEEITSFDELQYFIGLSAIGNEEFKSCSNLISIVLPNSITAIGNSAFRNCSSLTGDLVIPNSVTTIGERAFQSCSGFTGNLTIGNSVTTIGESAFYGCSGFTGDLVIPNSVTTINGYTFSGCSGFTGDLVIPNSVTTIGSNAFSSCNGFTGNLIIPNSVTTIGESAFYGCSGFTGDLVIPNSVTTINGYTFSGCSGFTGDLVIPNSVTTINGYAFSGCSGLNGSLIIGDGVTGIESFTFYNCGFTDSLVIGNSVTTIGGDAFRNCHFTGALVLGNSLTNFGSIFQNSGFTGSLVIPDTWTSIGESAFSGCSGFSSLTIGNSVTTIGQSAFYGCSGFTGELVIPNSVTTIGGYAFYDCSGFTSLTLGNSVTKIYNYAFHNCSGFTGSLVIPNSVTWLSGFDGCSGFTGDLVIPNSVDTIGGYAFRNCTGFNGSLTIGNSVNFIGFYSFYGCSGFTGDLVIPNSVTFIRTYSFYNCSGFTGNLTIGNSVTTIEQYAFYNCSGFAGNLTIGNSVTTIGEQAFCYCNNFSQIYSKNATPPTVGSYALYGINTSVPVLVPCGTQAIYKRASGWSSFTNYQEVPGEIVVSVNSEMLGEVSITLQGNCSEMETTVHAEPKTGGVFSNWTVDGEVVSTDEDYTFNLTEDITLVANFDVAPNYYFFVGNNSSLWNDAGNWMPQTLPTEGSTVSVYADLEMNSEASVSNLYTFDGNAITIKPEGNLSVTETLQLSGGKGDWHYYDNGTYNTAINLSTWAVMFPAGSYTGISVSKVMAYDYTNMIGTVTIYNDGSNAPANPVGSMDITFTGSSRFVEFSFAEPVEIDPTKNVWVVFQKVSGGSYPAAVCNGTGDPNGRWILYGSNWVDINSYGYNYTFMIRAFFEEPALLIEDGGQLYHSVEGIKATVQKTITPYTPGARNGWHLIANPLADDVNISDVQNLMSNEYDLYYYDEPSVYWINHEDTENNFTQMEVGKGYLYGNNCGVAVNYEYGFDDNTMDGWTNIDADGDGYGWHSIMDASTSHTGEGHIGSESWKYNPGPGALFPNNYIVSPQVRFGTTSAINFWACAEDASFPSEYFGVAVSTTGNTNDADFTTIQEWTLSAKSGRNIGTWYEYTVDLGQYAGQTGYVAIRHFNCSEQGALLIDDVTLSGMMESWDAMTVSFMGTIKNGSTTVNVPLSYTTNHALQGFNLVGNPFAHNVTSYASENVANGCYRMNEAKNDLIVSETSEANPLKPAEGFFVKATAIDASITFNPTNNTKQPKSLICVEVAETDKLIDRLIVKKDGQSLEKFSLSGNRTKLFVRQGHQEMAIVPCEGNEQPFCFKAVKDGSYTINVNTDELECNYLHLIDNLTGNDIDLLATPSYSFEAKTSDYASRFRLVFSICEDADSDNDTPFAFINNVCRDAARHVSTSGMVPGVYVLRLINGDNVKTQKIVVK